MIDRDGLICKLAPAYFAALLKTPIPPEQSEKCLGRPTDEMSQIERDARCCGRDLRDFATWMIMEIHLADDENQHSQRQRWPGRKYIGSTEPDSWRKA